ncbi:sugar O-acetyltransferase [bacterium]|nr:sugar O-acetyltransferase [bacterium]
MKSEKEKMLSGEEYLPETNELKTDRKRAKALCNKINSISDTENTERKILLKKLLGKCEDDIIIEPNFFCDYGYNISAGRAFYINHNCVILDCAPVKFGDNVIIGPNCGFYTAQHPINAEERAKGYETAKPITIGKNVWIGGNVTVLAGVTVGDNVVIGAGSVVTKDIPSNVVAFGNPCKAVKTID